MKKLTALKFDWGKNEEFRYVVEGCEAFSLELEILGIHHYAEEYLGRHFDKVWTDDGRALHSVLPFFDTYLDFE